MNYFIWIHAAVFAALFQFSPAFSDDAASSQPTGQLLYSLAIGSVGKVVHYEYTSDENIIFFLHFSSVKDARGALHSNQDVWVRYRATLASNKRTMSMINSRGRATSEFSDAVYIRAIRSGTSAWAITAQDESPKQQLLSPGGEDKSYLAQEIPADVLEAINSSPLPDDDADEKSAPAPKSSTGLSEQAITPGAYWAADCGSFIQRDRAYGPVGEKIMDTLNAQQFPRLFSSKIGDMPAICPKFSGFSTTQKKNFWVWVIASMAMTESGCNEELPLIQGPNGILGGILQLDDGRTSQYADGVCGDINALDPLASAVCTLQMLNQFMAYDDVLYWSESYWAELRATSPSHKTVTRLISEYTACR